MHGSNVILAWTQKTVTASVLTVGVSLNVATLGFGMQPVAERFFTPFGEALLTAWFFAALVLGVLVDRLIDPANRLGRIVHRIVTVYMGLLVLMHGVNNLLLGRVDWYVSVFSASVYPYAATVVLFAMALFTVALPLGQSPRAAAQAS